MIELIIKKKTIVKNTKLPLEFIFFPIIFWLFQALEIEKEIIISC